MRRLLVSSVVAVTVLGGAYFAAPLVMTKVHVAVQTEEAPAVMKDVLGEAERRALAEASGTIQQDAPQGRYLSFTNKSPLELFQNAEPTTPSR